MNVSFKQLVLLIAFVCVIAVVLTASITGKSVYLRINHATPDLEFKLDSPGPDASKAPPHTKPRKHAKVDKHRTAPPD